MTLSEGDKVGRLTLLSRIVDEHTYKTRYLCVCDCGTKKTVRTDALKSGATISCGCYHKERSSTHGFSSTRLYKIWDSMKQRCYNENCNSYVDYGNRGITICDSWKSDFLSFYNWSVSSGYRSDLTIERRDVNGNYEPSNCCWASRVDQNRNKRNTLTPSQVISIKQDSRTHRVIANEFGVNQSTITRIKNGLRWKEDLGDMARIHPTITIETGGSYPSLGSLLGTRMSTEVFTAMNDMGHSSIFGSEFDQSRNEFFTRYIQPMDRINLDISRTINALMNPDQIRILESIEDLRNIPPTMELAIALFDPIRQGITEGRFEGFGFDPATLPEDFYGRLIDNFTCEDVGEVMDSEGQFPVTATMFSDDPEFTDDELYAIRRTREYLWRVLEKTDRDPTAPDLPRG